MPRRIKTKFDRALVAERGETFGHWLALKRDLAFLSQGQAAQAAGISRRQWIRYEQGTIVPRKRMEVIARVVHAPLSKALELAGYKTTPRRNDYRMRINNIYFSLIEGSLEGALGQLLSVYAWMEIDKGKELPEWEGTTQPNFAVAVSLLDTLPDWLSTIVLSSMQKRMDAKKQGSKTPLTLKMQVLEGGMDLLRRGETRLPSRRPL